MRFVKRSWNQKWIYGRSWLLSKKINFGKNFSNYNPQNILLIKQDEIGDLCYALHIPELLHTKYPNAHISLLCKPFALTVARNNPYINDFFTSFDAITRKYDLLIDLKGSEESLKYARVHAPLIRLDRGTVRFRNGWKGNHPHEWETNTQVVAPLFSAKPPSIVPKLYPGEKEHQKINSLKAEFHLNDFVVFHSEARRDLRKWNKYALLAEQIFEIYKLPTVFIGALEDREAIEEKVAGISTPAFNFAGRIDLLELAVLIEKAKVYVGNDSGPLHIAALTQTPTLGLFGPGEPIVFYPKGANCDYIHEILSCNPCDQIHCIHPENPCMQRIELAEVMERVSRWLG